MAKKLMCAVLAHQRSGSNYLRSLLWTNPSIYSYGEVLYPNFDKDGFYYFYQQRLLENWNKLLISDPVISNDVFREFFEYSSEKRDPPVVCYDIKLDQLYAYPILYNALLNLNFKIVLLRRKNAVARVVSHHVMLKRFEQGDFNIHYSQPKLVQVTIDIPLAINMIKSGREFEEYIVEKYGSRTDIFMELAYEDLASEANRERELSRFATLLGAEKFKTDSKISPIKQSIWPLQEIATNWQELMDALHENGLGWAVEESHL